MKVFKHIPIDLGYADLLCETLSTGRTYLTPQGKKYPSITTVLGILSKNDIREWRQRVGEEEANRVSRRATGRGTQVHNLVEKYLNNTPLDESKLMPHIKNSFDSLKPLLEKHVDCIHLQENPLYSDHLQVAGRVDLIAEFDNQLAVIDIKTSNRAKTKDDIHGYFMQEAAYAIMFEERTGIPITKLVTIMAVDYQDPLVFVEHRDNWTKTLRETIREHARRRMFGHL